jgi:hypothetical protein
MEEMLAILLIGYLILLAIPTARILGRLGFSRWWAILLYVAPLNLIGLWVLAYARWPSEAAQSR